MQFKRLVAHVVVTADAFDRSRLRRKARTYFYKDIEFRIAYGPGARNLSCGRRPAFAARQFLNALAPLDNMHP
ncbi:DUF5086 family protein [Rhizobium leguminosarum]|uniref:DUF5086 family protein n=2 Tax=Rhizobium TaxID=379 RepID=UPI002FEE78E2